MSSPKLPKYSEEDMAKALEAVKSGTPVSTAAKSYNVPRTTLLYKHTGKYPIKRRMGPSTVLTTVEEQCLENWMLHSSHLRFPVNKEQLLDSVQMLISKMNRPNPFTDNRPGRHWYEAFLKRHPQISERVSQNLSGRRGLLTEQSLRNWFEEVQLYMEQNECTEVFTDPKRVYNMDETAFFLCPKGDKVLVKKGQKVVHNFTNNDDKECLTVLFGGNAAGMQTPPMIVFSYERIPPAIVNHMPPGWGIGKTENGWMTSGSFFEYIANIFYPWLLKQDITFPVLLFVDGHSSHLTMALTDFCIKHKIVLVSLFPNSTHICQPMDVAVFHPLKNGWKKGVLKWKMENNGRKLKRENFGPILKKVVEKTVTKDMLINGFRTCGLYPFNTDAIDYTKLIRSDPVTSHDQNISAQEDQLILNKNSAQMLKNLIDNEKLNRFKSCNGQWTGDIRDTSLYNLWKKYQKPEQTQDVVLEDSEWLNKLLDENNGSISIDINSATNSVIFDCSLNETSMLSEDIVPTMQTEDITLKEVGDNDVMQLENSTVKESHDSTLSALKDMNSELKQTEDVVQSNDRTLQEEEINNKASTSEHQQIEELNNNNLALMEYNDITPNNDYTSQEEESLDTTKEQQIEEVATPIKDTDKIPFNVPSPFKKILFWPDKVKTQGLNKRKPKDKIPSVATSDLWKQYYEKKENEKLQKEKEKEQRQKKREENKKNKTSLKRKRDKINEIDNEASDILNVEASSKDFDKSDLKVNSYVIVVYESEYYPGIIQEIKEKEAYVSVMTKTKFNNWKWPQNPDRLWYDKETEVIRIIKSPEPINNRGVYKVPEMIEISSI